MPRQPTADTGTPVSRDVIIPPYDLPGRLCVPANALGMVVFAHGSGSSRHSPRNMQVAESLQKARLATLLFDLLHGHEAQDRARVFDIPLLARRLAAAGHWTRDDPETAALNLGYFGASTGAAAALVAAAEGAPQVRAVVSRGGRPDLAGSYLTRVHVPTLLIVGDRDTGVIELNEQACAQLAGWREMRLVPGATHLFEEPGCLEAVVALTVDWFTRHLPDDPVDDPADKAEDTPESAGVEIHR